MRYSMEITQMDNGWLLDFIGHDALEKKVLCREWDEVIKVMDDHFGWYDAKGKFLKKNPYPDL